MTNDETPKTPGGMLVPTKKYLDGRVETYNEEERRRDVVRDPSQFHFEELREILPGVYEALMKIAPGHPYEGEFFLRGAATAISFMEGAYLEYSMSPEIVFDAKTNKERSTDLALEEVDELRKRIEENASPKQRGLYLPLLRKLRQELAQRGKKIADLEGKLEDADQDLDNAIDISNQYRNRAQTYENSVHQLEEALPKANSSNDNLMSILSEVIMHVNTGQLKPKDIAPYLVKVKEGIQTRDVFVRELLYKIRQYETALSQTPDFVFRALEEHHEGVRQKVGELAERLLQETRENESLMMDVLSDVEDEADARIIAERQKFLEYKEKAEREIEYWRKRAENGAKKSKRKKRSD